MLEIKNCIVFFCIFFSRCCNINDDGLQWHEGKGWFRSASANYLKIWFVFEQTIKRLKDDHTEEIDIITKMNKDIVQQLKQELEALKEVPYIA